MYIMAPPENIHSCILCYVKGSDKVIQNITKSFKELNNFNFGRLRLAKHYADNYFIAK